MLTVYKYSTPLGKGPDNFCIPLPKYAEILTVEVQNNDACIWVTVDTENATEDRYFRWAGTGHDLNDDHFEIKAYIGSVILHNGALVFHLFETTPIDKDYT